jgi:thiol-disulfide isomerase/thioredoxin
VLSLALAGCVGMKKVDVGPRTIPSVGDRQINVTSGRPGEEAIIRTETATPKLDMREARRISGRVIDHRGQPVSGATVRLADGALAAGQISDVITDEAGGFTVRGLRASTPYTLIATLDLGGESRVSRSRFFAGETQARLILEPAANYGPGEAPATASAPVRTDRRTTDRPAEVAVSGLPMPPKGRWVFVDDSSNQVVASVPARTEDVGVKRVSRGRSAEETVDTGKTEEQVPDKPVNSNWRSKSKPSEKVVRDPEFRPASYVSDEVNPLPPAHERKAFVYEEFEDETPPPRRRIALAPPESLERSPGNAPDELVPVTETPPAEEIVEKYDRRGPEAVARQEPVTRKEPVAQQGSAERPLPRTSKPGPVYQDAPSAGSLRVEDIEEVNRIIRARRERERAAANGESPSEYVTYADSNRGGSAERPAGSESEPRTDRKINRTVRSSESLAPPSDLPDFRESSRSSTDSSGYPTRGLERSFAQRESIDRSLKSTSSTSESMVRDNDYVARTEQERIDRLIASDPKRGNAFNGDEPRTSNEWINRLTASMPWSRKSGGSSDPLISGAFCDFDAVNQRLVDFELTDIKGRATRFSQIPSDLTLVVFWGTWCKPCHEAMPHLVELQRRLEADGVQILGIAYEEGTFAERQEKVAAAVERYDINFPILLGGAQGAENCPVRKSMGVRVYPTLILVDRAGRVLWRDQGVTRATFGRLDRVMAAHLQELDRKQQVASGNSSYAR